MRDIPVFTTEYGAASLTLREIPYRKMAYIRLQATEMPGQLLSQCVDFCKACGAERIFAAGDDFLEKYPLHTEIWRMQAQSLPQTDASLFPLQSHTLSRWLECYNRRMADVPNAATLTVRDGEKLLEEGSGYFVHRGDILIGIGKATGDRIEAVASLIPGGGRDTVLALATALASERVLVEVASENRAAVRLYERLGFVKASLLSRWFRVV